MLLKVFKFACERSVNCVSLFEAPFAFRAVYMLLLEVFSYILLHRIVQSFTTIAVCLVLMCPKLRALYRTSIVHIRQYLGFKPRQVPASSYLIFQTEAIENYELY